MGTPLGKAPDGASYNQVINGHFYWYQEEWSNQGDECLQRLTFAGEEPTATFTSTPRARQQGRASTRAARRRRAGSPATTGSSTTVPASVTSRPRRTTPDGHPHLPRGRHLPGGADRVRAPTARASAPLAPSSVAPAAGAHVTQDHPEERAQRRRHERSRSPAPGFTGATRPRRGRTRRAQPSQVHLAAPPITAVCAGTSSAAAM